MSHSLIRADRATHLKILCIALLGAITVVVVGVTARTAAHDTSAQLVIKAIKPTAFTARDASAIR